MKGEVGKVNTGKFRMAAVRGDVSSALDHVITENWRKACRRGLKEATET